MATKQCGTQGRCRRITAILSLSAAVCLPLVAVQSSLAAEATVPSTALRLASGSSEGVSAILLDSYRICDVSDAWQTLNEDWSKFGSIQLSITTGGVLCTGHFTLADLQASGADTVVVSDTAWSYKWTANEVSALQQYVEEGHTLVGLGVDFQWHQHDDGALAPLFGLAEQVLWQRGGPGGPHQPTYDLRLDDPAAQVIFRSVSDPYASSHAGNFVQMPYDEKWSSNDLAGAAFLGLSRQRRAAITLYKAPSYTAIYIASAAWYQSTPDDLQFLYNALVYPQQG